MAYDRYKDRAICPSRLSRTTPPGQGSRTLALKAVLTFQVVPEFTASDRLMACTREAQGICTAGPQEGCAAVHIGARDQRLWPSAAGAWLQAIASRPSPPTATPHATNPWGRSAGFADSEKVPGLLYLPEYLWQEHSREWFERPLRVTQFGSRKKTTWLKWPLHTLQIGFEPKRCSAPWTPIYSDHSPGCSKAFGILRVQLRTAKLIQEQQRAGDN